MKQYLFVYGSLREGFFNFDKYIKDQIISRRLGKIKGILYHMPNKGYPAALKGNGEVVGEVIELKNWNENIKSLDAMENYISDRNDNNEYNRELVEVEIMENEDKGKKLKAFAYLYNMNDEDVFNKNSIYISHGDWKKFMLQENK
ncbi:gamma-glutamylcyclotransferase [Clostridium sporogenes]|uniref:gamma-glutamylcyclotransferase family protein n=1 Tax=Clostridium sporogenes TaxID=1509 RepID=UPI0013D712EF|nr:gamma-glutamylcyclotransferase family protein [Clostridium sporogenes]NFV14000.1 gamma-glutamylcyclotransferase [Clostridium sporogenes]